MMPDQNMQPTTCPHCGAPIQVQKAGPSAAPMAPAKPKKNAAHMPVDELKEVIKSQEKPQNNKESM